jgi:hypothetical protein
MTTPDNKIILNYSNANTLIQVAVFRSGGSVRDSHPYMQALGYWIVNNQTLYTEV